MKPHNPHCPGTEGNNSRQSRFHASFSSPPPAVSLTICYLCPHCRLMLYQLSHQGSPGMYLLTKWQQLPCIHSINVTQCLLCAIIDLETGGSVMNKMI